MLNPEPSLSQRSTANGTSPLISNEVGTSAFLATLLDLRYDHLIFVQARAATALVLRNHGLELSSPAPTHVELEYSNIDIVAVWAGWTILVKNKVASASVTRGQIAISHQRTAPCGVALLGKATHKLSALGIHRGLQQFHSLLSKQFGQRIAQRALTSNRNNPIVIHGGGGFLY